MSSVAGNAESPTPVPEQALPERAPRRSSSVRALTESLVCLLLAVVLFRTFEVEGYMISTGSMAPSLFGYHKRVLCPTCGYRFACGVSAGASGGGFADDDGESGGSHARCDCPNCGQTDIELDDVPRNQGDQLLVHRNAFQFHPPRAWEVVVFRNPSQASQAYVKRVVGLPGETVRIVDGDVWIDGSIRRKDFAAQQAVRIPVHDHDFEPPHDPSRPPRWIAEPAAPGTPSWQPQGTAFSIDSRVAPPPIAADGRASEPSRGDWAWIGYRHAIDGGGQHVTAVPLAVWPETAALPESLFEQPVWYDADRRELRCTGVLTAEWQERLLDSSGDGDFRQAVQTLAAESRLSPVLDDYAYNVTRSAASVAVRDLMLSLRVRFAAAQGEFVVRMSDGRRTYDALFDLARRELRLHVDGAAPAERTARLPDDVLMHPVLVEMSLFDRQVLVALDGRPALAPLELQAEPPEKAARRPVRLGARNLLARVEAIQLHRDVHYRSDSPRNARHGIDEPFVLGPDQYFVLGDNSPVSSDSRCWADGAVDGRLLLGKPFVVHLPSRPGRLRLGDRAAYFRLPDFERMRAIR